jgi:hypothetical protein
MNALGNLTNEVRKVVNEVWDLVNGVWTAAIARTSDEGEGVGRAEARPTLSNQRWSLKNVHCATGKPALSCSAWK